MDLHMAYRSNLNTDQDRGHCRMDLDLVHDAATAARFIARWRNQLEGYLVDPPEDQESMDALREEANKAEECAARLAEWIGEAIKSIDGVGDDLYADELDIDDLSGRLGTIVETLQTRLTAEDF